MVCLQNLAAGAPADHSFFPFSWHLANPRWWDDLGIAPFHPTIPPQVHVPDVTHPTFYSTTSLYPPDHLSFLTTTNVILPPPTPKHGQFDRHVGHSPPTVRNFLQHCLYIIWGTLCPLTCLRYFLRNCLYFIWGMLCPLTCYTAG